MRRPSAILGSALFFIAAPGVVAGLVPWLITRWEGPTQSPAPQFLAALLITGGALALIGCFLRFALEGRGTPAPVAPTAKLVVGGLYRYVRNPMYVAVIAILIGQAALFGSGALALYTAIVAAAVAMFVSAYEEPTLASRYGAEYETYRKNVPGWLPRLRPWRG